MHTCVTKMEMCVTLSYVHSFDSLYFVLPVVNVQTRVDIPG